VLGFAATYSVVVNVVIVVVVVVLVLVVVLVVVVVVIVGTTSRASSRHHSSNMLPLMCLSPAPHPNPPTTHHHLPRSAPWSTIAEAVPNSGSFRWRTPETTAAGAQHEEVVEVRVRSVANSAISDIVELTLRAP
jgi:hypothetical protein